MDPFELTKDPDGGGMTVRVKHGFVVLTREEEGRVTERLAGLIDENAKLREQVTRLQADWESERDYADQMEVKEKRAVAENAKLRELVRKWYPYALKRVGRDALEQWGQMEVVRELGIEVGE